MKIKAGDLLITVKDIYGENAFFDGKTRPTLRVSTDTPLTESEITALQGNDWELIENSIDGDYVASTHKGYGAVYRHQAVFIQTETAEEREATLLQRIAELEAQKQEATAAFEAVTQELITARVDMPISNVDTKKGE